MGKGFSFKSYRRILLLTSFLFGCEFVFSQTEPWKESFSRDAERERVLGLMTNYPMPDFQVVDVLDATSEQVAFVTFFQKNIWPELRELPELTRLWWDPPGGRIEIVNNALNRALYDSPEEEHQWQKWEEEISIRYRRVLSSVEWQSKVKTWAELSKGLTGELADLARRMHSDLEVIEFTPMELPLFERLAEIEAAVHKIARKSRYAQTLDQTNRLATDYVQAFHEGRMSFDAAWRSLEALKFQGSTAMGHDIALQARDLLQEAAEIRTRLAKGKGYATWAQYVLATYSRHHADGFKTVGEWEEFLQKTLDQTAQPARDFLAKRAVEFGLKYEELRPSQVSLLLLPADVRVREYFPKEKSEALWIQTMLESGFSREDIDSIHRDMFPRPGKQTHAYLSYNLPSRPKILRVSAKKLEAVIPDPKDAAAWIPIALDIIQNMRDDGIDSASTMLHEGGHGLEHKSASPYDIWGRGSSNAYSETHSMTMELYLMDLDYLLHAGKTREGKALDRETAARYITEAQINELFSFRRIAAQSLSDLRIWDFEYGPGKERLVERMVRIYGAGLDAATQIKEPESDVDSRFRVFSTDHFYSGTVRYWGYAGAKVAAELVFDALLDHLGKTTGRRTVANQPGVARFLQEGIYEHGGELPFPASVEKITGKKYSPEAVVARTVAAVAAYQGCAEDLARLILPVKK